MSNAVCSKCGHWVGNDAAIPGNPCPICGSISRNVPASAESRIQLSNQAVSTQRFGHTGREVLGSQAKVYAEEWVNLSGHIERLNHEATEDFRELIAEATCLTGEVITLFRGRGIKETAPPSLEAMGPLPTHIVPRQGRYHRKGNRVLYLADSENGVRREMEAWHVEGTPWIITTELPLTSLRIANFTNLPVDHFLTAAFSVAEMCKVKNRGPDNYEFSQVIGKLVAEQFDGMLIPGVRGEPGSYYNNVVIFRQLEDWPIWSHGEPYILSS